MTDREKLVRLIDEAADIKPVSHGGQISYYLDSEKIADHLISHGVTVKEPNKVLSLSEVFEGIKEERCFYIEDIEAPSNTGWDNCNAVDYWLNKGVNKYDMREDYGKHWRCWAEKPTEEERKAAEWES